MCGIAGIYSLNRNVTESEIQSMCDIFSYRGPDDQGIWVNETGHVALGHRRLSILDPTPAGHQPMHDQEADLTIVYNGEVYNFIEIRNTLKSHGHSFKTNTDTEVILAAYKEWGHDCLQRFIGMFAFAIWDGVRNELFAARDRLGIKPFYYYRDPTIFHFSSEVKSLLSLSITDVNADLSLVDYYMSFGYVPGEQTLFKNIRRLLPAHYIVVKNGGSKIEKYWDLKFNNSMDLGLEFYIGELEKLINNSIDLRLRTDVPLGIFLSGGIDSSAVVAMLAPRTSERLKTFSVAYDFGTAFNETSYARVVAEKFNTDHHEFIVTAENFKEFIPGFIYHMDEPVAESAAISLYYIAKLAREYITVVLSGEGSDEIFAGYDFYFYNQIIEKYRNNLSDQAVSYISNWLISCIHHDKICKYLRLSRLPFERRYKGTSTYEENEKNNLYSSDFKAYIECNPNENLDAFLFKIYRKTQQNDPLSRMLYFDTKTWLVDDLLIKADKMSMAASLELRVPFLDHRIVEFAGKIPSKYKIQRRTTKYILKKMIEKALPRKIIYRKKMGFPTPLRDLFRQDLFDYARDTLLTGKAIQRGFFKHTKIEKLLDEHKKGQRDHHRLIWQLIVLEEWHRRFVNT